MIPSKLAGLRTDPTAVRAIPFAIFIGFMAFAGAPEPVLAHLPFDARWIPVLRGVAVAIALALFWPSCHELHGHGSRPAPADLFLGLGVGLMVFSVWINLDQPWATLASGGGFDPRRPDSDAIDWPLALLRLAGLALVVPVMEELFWRSFLMRWIDRTDFMSIEPGQVSVRAFLITAGLFALEHNQLLAGFIAGVAYSWLYTRSGKLWVPVLAHAATNGVLGVWILATGNWQFW